MLSQILPSPIPEKNVEYNTKCVVLAFYEVNVAKKSSDQLTPKREQMIRKSFAFTQHDAENIDRIKDKCLNHKIVLNDSHAVRLAIQLAANLSDEALASASVQVEKVPIGRPKIENE